MKYNFNNEFIEEEEWKWEAEYQNGYVLKQFDDEGHFHQFKEINQSELVSFRMVSEGKPGFTLLFNPSTMKLVHFYKRFRLNVGTDEESKFTVYCFGWETKIFNRTAKSFIMILPGGECIFTPDTNLVDYK